VAALPSPRTTQPTSDFSPTAYGSSESEPAPLFDYLAERAEDYYRASHALVKAAAEPLPPEPCLKIKLPVEGTAQLEFVAESYGELERLVYWLASGPYSGIAAALQLRA
jgi:hypothetical protein